MSGKAWTGIRLKDHRERMEDVLEEENQKRQSPEIAEPWFESDPTRVHPESAFPKKGRRTRDDARWLKVQLPVATVTTVPGTTAINEAGMRALGLLVDKPANCHCSCNPRCGCEGHAKRDARVLAARCANTPESAARAPRRRSTNSTCAESSGELRRTRGAARPRR